MFFDNSPVYFSWDRLPLRPGATRHAAGRAGFARLRYLLHMPLEISHPASYSVQTNTNRSLAIRIQLTPRTALPLREVGDNPSQLRPAFAPDTDFVRGSLRQTHNSGTFGKLAPQTGSF